MADRGQERVWLVTGCSSGIGRALAEALVEHGERVVVTARKVETVRDLEQKAPGRTKAIALDISDPKSISSAIAEAIEAMGRIDVLINNAGIAIVGAVEETSTEEIERIYRTNVFGTLGVIRAVLPQMRKRGDGHIITVTSIGGIRGQKGTGIYNSSKFALEGAHESLSKEVGPMGVRITVLEPGQIETEFRKRSMQQATPLPDYAEAMAAIRSKVGLDYPATAGDPKLVAEAVITMVKSDRPPPFRLTLGADAVAQVREKIALLIHDLDEWESLSHTVVPRRQVADSRG